MQHLSLLHHYFAFWYGRFENASWDLIWPYNGKCNVDSGTVAPCHIHSSDGCLEILSSCSSVHTEGKDMVLLEHVDLFYLCSLCWQYLHWRTNSLLRNCPYPNTLQQSVTWTFVKMMHLIAGELQQKDSSFSTLLELLWLLLTFRTYFKKGTLFGIFYIC